MTWGVPDPAALPGRRNQTEDALLPTMLPEDGDGGKWVTSCLAGQPVFRGSLEG